MPTSLITRSVSTISWFNGDEVPRRCGWGRKIYSLYLGWMCGITLFLVYTLSFIFYQLLSHSPVSWTELLCVPAFGATQAALMFGLIVCVGIAVKMYSETNRFWATSEDLSTCRMSMFNELAKRHKHLSQLWFTIALAIFLGGLIYAAYHVMEGPCRKHFWDTPAAAISSSALPHTTAATSPAGEQQAISDNGDADIISWTEIVSSILPNIFLYSIFFVGWGWALNNYRAHWHNFVTNEHRHASLLAIDRIRESACDDVKGQLELQAAVVVMVPTESAYLEGEGDKEVSAGERLLRIEEAVRGLVAHGKA